MVYGECFVSEVLFFHVRLMLNLCLHKVGGSQWFWNSDYEYLWLEAEMIF